MPDTQLQNQNGAEKPEPSIRTMKSDVQELLKTAKPSFIQIVSQEVPGTPTGTGEGFNPKRLWPILAVTLAALTAIGGTAYFLFGRTVTETPAPKLVPPAPYFAVEASRTISVKSSDRTQFLRLMADAASEREREGTVKRTLIKVQDGPAERFATMADFFNFYRVVPSENFMSSVGAPLMVFFYQSVDGARFGMAFRTRDPDRTLAELIHWEPSLLSDLNPLFFNAKPEVIIAPFEDRTYRNIDWRFIKLAQKEDLGIGYTIFPAHKIVVLTTSRDAMETIINRLFEAR